MDTIRVGKVSSVNHDEGKIRVVYSDRDNATTIELPLVVFNNTYRMPKVDDQVIVLHQPNGAASGFVLGDFWSQTHETHDQKGEGKTITYYDRDGKCYSIYSDTDNGGGDGKFEFHNDDKIEADSDDDIKITSDKAFTIEGAEKVTVKSDGSIEISASSGLTIKGSSVTVQGGTVDINGTLTINGMPYLAHTHGNGNEGAPTFGVIST